MTVECVSCCSEHTSNAFNLQTPRCHFLFFVQISNPGVWASCGFLAGPGQSLLLLPDHNDVNIVNLKGASSFKLTGHTKVVLDIHAHGDLAVSTSSDDALRVWDPVARECRLTIQAGMGIQAVCMWDGFVASARVRDHTIHTWDIATGAKAGTVMSGHTDDVLELRHVQACGLLLSASDDKTVKVWDVRSGRCVRTLTGHSNGVCSVSACRQGRTAMSASQDICVWDLGSGRCVSTMSKEQPGGQWRVWMDGSGTTAVSAADSGLNIWDVALGRLSSEHSWPNTQIQGLSCNIDLSMMVAVVEQQEASNNTWRVWGWGV